MMEQSCTILEKHMDDYPNLYYTIRLEKDGRDKQTIPTKLSHKLRPQSDASGMHFRVEWSTTNAMFNISHVNPDFTIRELQEYIENTAIHAGFKPALVFGPHDKLVCRGKVLDPDPDGLTTIRSLRLKNGSMISIQRS